MGDDIFTLDGVGEDAASPAEAKAAVAALRPSHVPSSDCPSPSPACALPHPTPFGSAPGRPDGLACVGAGWKAGGSDRGDDADTDAGPGAATPALPPDASATSLRSRCHSLAHDPEECPVCLEDFLEDPAVLTACCHRFHLQCVLAWASRGASTCPLCFRRLVLDDAGLGAVLAAVVGESAAAAAAARAAPAPRQLGPRHSAPVGGGRDGIGATTTSSSSGRLRAVAPAPPPLRWSGGGLASPASSSSGGAAPSSSPRSVLGRAGGRSGSGAGGGAARLFARWKAGLARVVSGGGSRGGSGGLPAARHAHDAGRAG